MLELKEISHNDLDTEEYKKIFDYSDVSTPFHSLEWLEIMLLINKDSELKYKIITETQTAKVLAIMPFWGLKNKPFRMFTPLGGYTGFIYDINNKNTVLDFLKNHNFVKLFSHIIIFDDDIYDNFKYLIKNKTNYSTWIIDTTIDFDTFIAKINGKTRNQIKKAFKEEVEFKNIETKEELEECKNLYSFLVSKHNIKNPYSIFLFEKIYEYSLKNPNMFFKIAKYNDETIAYMICFKSRKQMFYWMTSSNPNFSKLNAQNGLLATFIELCCKDPDIKIFNMGGIQEGNESLLHYKISWASEEKKYYGYSSILKKLFGKM